MVLSLQFRLGLHVRLLSRPDDTCPSIGQFPTELGFASRRLGVFIGIRRRAGRRLVTGPVETRYLTLALEATYPIDHDEGHQCQPKNDQPLSKFHGSSCLLLRRHA
ncbi:hypothetical protein A8U91_03515 [Halomonas elongata]|uniref:Uncharacterized protein n=1 Tax=Halomonas elongata TaxID=2746 RepID=A0A1B8NWT7_HALEL|nr:hypothetical protein A8U91_03515 [Halomonas elongata]